VSAATTTQIRGDFIAGHESPHLRRKAAERFDAWLAEVRATERQAGRAEGVQMAQDRLVQRDAFTMRTLAVLDVLLDEQR
jgi:hypothetical protein